MAPTTNPLRLALADALGPAGFARKGNDWLRRSDDVIEVVNLQRSQWGNQYYLNYALWLRALGEVPVPKEHTCHVRWRAERVMARDAPLARLLDLESGADEPERLAALARLLTSQLLPFTDTCRTIRDLQALLAAGTLEGATTLAARAVLSPPPI